LYFVEVKIIIITFPSLCIYFNLYLLSHYPQLFDLPAAGFKYMLDDHTLAFPLIIRPGDFTPGLTYPNVYSLQSRANNCGVVTVNGVCVGLNLPLPNDMIYNPFAGQGDFLSLFVFYSTARKIYTIICTKSETGFFQ
jgi:hypothetical protein